MTFKTKQYPIVGTAYRPPADAFVKVMSVGTRLYLVPEPFNEHDRNAIAVYVDLDHAIKNHPRGSNEAVKKELGRPNYEPWIGKTSVQIGYLTRQTAAYLKSHGFGDAERTAEFTYPFGSNLPHARFEFDDGTT